MQFNFKKKFGQNFLINEGIIEKIASNVFADKIYEIGPGSGALTKKLLNLNKKIKAIEIDSECIEILRKKFENEPNFDLIQTDALEFKFDKNIFIVGNLPYNIGTKIIENFVLNDSVGGIFMLQKEVADRILNCDNKLGVFVQSLFDVSKIMNVSAENFFPKPKVNSSVIALKRNNRPLFDMKKFKQMLFLFFSQPRKKISFIRHYDELLFKKIIEQSWDLNLRAENVKKEDYIKLALN